MVESKLFEKSLAKTFGLPMLYLVNGAQHTIVLTSFGGSMWSSTPTTIERPDMIGVNR
jgi:hypothetical protein